MRYLDSNLSYSEPSITLPPPQPPELTYLGNYTIRVVNKANRELTGARFTYVMTNLSGINCQDVYDNSAIKSDLPDALPVGYSGDLKFKINYVGGKSYTEASATGNLTVTLETNESDPVSVVIGSYMISTGGAEEPS